MITTRLVNHLGVAILIAAPTVAGAVLLFAGQPWGAAALWSWALAGAVIIARYGRARAARVPKQFVLSEQLLQAQKLASLGELAAGIAHEINNPLAIIRQEAEYAQFLLKKSASGGPELAELQDCLREVITQVDRSREITRNLLDFARKREPVLQKVQINRLIEDMARLVEKEAKNKNINLFRHYDPGLPVITSDPPLLRQVILNLLNNATQAIGRDGDLTITTASLPDGEISITVADSGPGIPPEFLPKIFEPFFTTKPLGQGTGLGLAICHGIIQKLGGSITAQSPPGRGAVFTITIPLEVESEKGKGESEKELVERLESDYAC